jgi:hypothetical protein
MIDRTRKVVADVRGGARSSFYSIVLVGFLFSLAALAQLNGLLTGMHLEGTSGHTIGDLASLLHPENAQDRAGEVIRTWREWDAEQDTLIADVMAPVWVAVLHTAIDMVFAAAYTTALVLFFRSVKAPSAIKDEEDVAKWCVWLAVALGVTDGLENLLEVRVLYDGWWSADWRPGEAILIGPEAVALSVVALLKYFLAIAVLVPAIVLGWLKFRRWRGGANSTFGPAVVRLRLHLLLVFGFVLLLLVHEQMPDLIRRWNTAQLGWAVATTFLFAGVVWVATSSLLANGPRTTADVRGVPPRDELRAGQGPGGEQTPGPSARRRRPYAGGVYIVALLLLGAAIVDAATNRWFEFGYPWGLAIPAAAILFLGVVGHFFKDAATVAQEPSPPIDKTSDGYVLTRVLPAIIIIAVGLAVFRASFGYSIYLRNWTWSVAFVLGSIALFTILGLFFRAGRPRGAATQPGEALWIRIQRQPLSWSFEGALFGFLVLRIVNGKVELDPALLVVAALFLAFSGWFAFQTLDEFDASTERVTRPAVRIGLLAVGALWASALMNPWATARELGGIAIVTGFMAALALASWLIIHFSDGVPPPAALRALQFRRTPIVTFLIGWFLLASAIDPGGFHDIRTTNVQGAGETTLAKVWSCWKQRNGLGAAQTFSCPDPASQVSSALPVTPLIFVATTGGGIRAAYWTAVVLDCAFEVDVDSATDDFPCLTGERASDFRRSDAVLAMSGISGGSLGLVSYSAFLSQKTGITQAGWPASRLDDDSLSASVAWWLFLEGPWSLLRFSGVKDRAAVMELGWERDWHDSGGAEGLAQPFLRLASQPHVPLLLLNGTSVVDGCRFNVSPLDASIEEAKTNNDGAPDDLDELERCRSTEQFEETSTTEARDLTARHQTPDSTLGATRDLVDFLCGGGHDLPLSTAALLSGRFPFVSPAGRVEQQCDNHRVSYVVDGGYLDTSGASPVLELYERLLPRIENWNRQHRKHCVVPFMIQIDNGADAGYKNLSKRPQELLVPLRTLFASRIGRAAESRSYAALLFNTRFGATGFAKEDGSLAPLQDRYAHFVNLAHPGPQAPLGWTLSTFSRDDLRAQLGQSLNVEAMNEVRTWFAAARDGRLACHT